MRSNRSRIFSGLFRKLSGPPGSVVLSYRNGRGFEHSTPFSRSSERHLRLLTGKTGVVILHSSLESVSVYGIFRYIFFFVSIFELLHNSISLPRVIDRFIPHLFSFFFSFSLMGSNLIGRERGVCALAMMGAGSWELGRSRIERDWIGIGRLGRNWETQNFGPRRRQGEFR